MRNTLKLGIISFAFGLFFIGADTVTAQSRENRSDYDGDGKTDLAIYRRGSNVSQPSYYWINGSQSGVKVIQWGRQAIRLSHINSGNKTS